MSNEPVYETQYLRFYRYHPQSRKTPIFYIRPVKDDFTLLGAVKWYGPFRKYAFYPEDGTVYDTKCLEDIINFINELSKGGYNG